MRSIYIHLERGRQYSILIIIKCFGYYLSDSWDGQKKKEKEKKQLKIFKQDSCDVNLFGCIIGRKKKIP